MLVCRDMAIEGNISTPQAIISAAHSLDVKKRVVRTDTNKALYRTLAEHLDRDGTGAPVVITLNRSALREIREHASPFLAESLARGGHRPVIAVVEDLLPSGETRRVIAVGFARDPNSENPKLSVFNGRGYTAVDAPIALSLYPKDLPKITPTVNRAPLSQRAKDIGLLLRAVASGPQR